jgi:hypothetical protein
MNVDFVIDNSSLNEYYSSMEKFNINNLETLIQKDKPILPLNAHLCELTQQAKTIFKPNSGNIISNKRYPTHLSLCGYTLTFCPQFEDKIKELIENEEFFETFYSIDNTSVSKFTPRTGDILPMQRIIQKLVNKKVLSKQKDKDRAGYSGRTLDIFSETVQLPSVFLGFPQNEMQMTNFPDLRKARWKSIMQIFEFRSDRPLELNMPVADALKNTTLFLSEDNLKNTPLLAETIPNFVIRVDTRHYPLDFTQ